MIESSYNPIAAKNEYETKYAKMNAEQKEIFEEITTILDGNSIKSKIIRMHFLLMHQEELVKHLYVML